MSSSSKPFKVKRRGEMLRYSRPNINTYEDENGDIQTSPINSPRYEYKDGYPYGLKMGDGDTASMPLVTNDFWPVNGQVGTVVTTYNAPMGEEFIKCGTLSLTGHGAMKTVIHKTTPNDILAPTVSVSPSAIDTTNSEECHLLIFKFYGEDIDFTSYTEHEAMTELNSFVHGIWS